MKSPSFLPGRHRHGFTLIELLVVVVIIAILVSLSVPVYNLVLRKTNEARTKATMHAVLAAVGHYQTDYNRFPLDSSLGGTSGNEDMEPLKTDGTGEANSPINILMAQNGDATPNMNSRRIKYVDLPQAKNGLFGVVDSSGGGGGSDGAPLQLMDIWGQPYTLQFDTNYDNRIQNPDKSNSDQTIAERAGDYVTSKAIMYSNGPDREPQTKDDIVTWR